MNFILKISGLLAYIISYPFTRILIYNSRRAYLALIYKDQLFLTKNWLGDQKTWRLVGGGVHEREEYLNGLIRECQEEINLKLDPKELKPIIGPMKHPKGYEFTIFRYDCKTEPKINKSRELNEARFISFEELRDAKNKYSFEVEKLLAKLAK